MSSEAASPLNPYALAGIAGERAEAWAGLGFSASFAGHWATAGFEPAAASEWVAGGFSPDDAAEWTQLSLDPHDALLCVRSEERRGGKACGSTRRCGGRPEHYKKKITKRN